jgi:hypothetical protein
MGSSKPVALVPLFDLKFLYEVRRLYRRNFKSAALAERSFASGPLILTFARLPVAKEYH